MSNTPTELCKIEPLVVPDSPGYASANEAGTGMGATSIADYYDDTLIDYDVWSKQGYLHFGYSRPWLNPFARQPMLEEMNRFIFQHLQLVELQASFIQGDTNQVGGIADLGCGVGAVSRFGSRLYSQLQFHAMTISPGQVAEAQQRHADEQVAYYCGDYHCLPFPDQSLSGVFYLESLCHSTRPEAALAEAARTLKSGCRIVMTDGFLKRPLESTSPIFRYVVKSVAHNWAVPMFHEIDLARGWNAGGQLKLVQDIECGWRLGPSALHAAHLSLIHWCKLVLKRRVTLWQWRHLTASAFTMLLGLYRRNFRYHLLVFEKC